MNLNEMQNTWNSPCNNLPTQERQRLASQFTRKMIRRRRFRAIWLINTFVWLTIITWLAIRTVAIGKVNLEQEWGLFPILMVPWAFAIYFLCRHLNPVPVAARCEASVIDSLRVALNSNRTEQLHLKVMAVLFVILIPLLAVSMRQLHAAGKVSGRELTSMALFFGTIFLASGAGIAARYFGRLLPQQKQLDALLDEPANEGK